MGSFLLLGFQTLAIANAVSCLLCIIGYILVRHQAYTSYFFLSVGDILFHAVFATQLLGWDTGFHYHAAIIAYALFFFPRVKCPKFPVFFS